MGTVLITAILSSLLTISLFIIYSDIREKRLKQNNSERGIMLLLEWAIRKECRYHLAVGEINKENLADLKRMWYVYHYFLRGNGYLNDIMLQVEDLYKTPDRLK